MYFGTLVQVPKHVKVFWFHLIKQRNSDFDSASKKGQKPLPKGKLMLRTSGKLSLMNAASDMEPEKGSMRPVSFCTLNPYLVDRWSESDRLIDIR